MKSKKPTPKPLHHLLHQPGRPSIYPETLTREQLIYLCQCGMQLIWLQLLDKTEILTDEEIRCVELIEDDFEVRWGYIQGRRDPLANPFNEHPHKD